MLMSDVNMYLQQWWYKNSDTKAAIFVSMRAPEVKRVWIIAKKKKRVGYGFLMSYWLNGDSLECIKKPLLYVENSYENFP